MKLSFLLGLLGGWLLRGAVEVLAEWRTGRLPENAKRWLHKDDDGT